MDNTYCISSKKDECVVFYNEVSFVPNTTTVLSRLPMCTVAEVISASSDVTRVTEHVIRHHGDSVTSRCHEETSSCRS